MVAVVLPSGCKVPQIWWLKITDKFSFIILEAVNSRCRQGHVSSEVPERDLFLFFLPSCFWCLLEILGCLKLLTYHSGLCLCLDTDFSLFVSRFLCCHMGFSLLCLSKFPHFYKDTSHWISITLIPPYDLILTNYISKTPITQ